MGWHITHDHLVSQGWDNYKSQRGRESKSTPYKGGKHRIRVYDDDKILYYAAICDDDESMEAFHDWACADSGTTYSEWYDEEQKKWRGFIG